MRDVASEMRELALLRAQEEWERGVRDPVSSVMVDRDGKIYEAEKVDGEWTCGVFIEEEKEPGLYSRIMDYIHEGLGWDWIKAYRNRAFQWCGAFASFLYREVREDLRKRNMSSTYRLRRWAKEDSSIVVPLDEILPGDIVVVGKGINFGGKSYGDHITICERVEKDGVYTIEGNAFGEHQSGKRREGVIREFRPFKGPSDKYTVRFAYRMQEQHFDEELL